MRWGGRDMCIYDFVCKAFIGVRDVSPQNSTYIIISTHTSAYVGSSSAFLTKDHLDGNWLQ